jgi:hypothetical protein
VAGIRRRDERLAPLFLYNLTVNLMNSNSYDIRRFGVNPFVRAGLDIILEQFPDSCALPELAACLAAREPKLSPLNIECAAKEALRLAPDYRKAIAEAAKTSSAAVADDCGDASELAA